MDACKVFLKGRGVFCRIKTVYLKQFTRPVVEPADRVKKPVADVREALCFGQIKLVSLQQLGVRLERFYCSLALLNIDAGTNPLDDNSVRVRQGYFERDHPSISVVSPPH